MKFEDANMKHSAAAMDRSAKSVSHAGWTYLSNHAHVLVCLTKNPESRLRDIAEQVGITERAVSRILTELEGSKVIEKHRVGRRNHYTLNRQAPLRHSLESHASIGDLLKLIV